MSSNASIRFASFNASLNRSAGGELITDLSTPDNLQAHAIAETIQRNNPDVVLVNEFDFDAEGEAAALFQENYLSVSQNGVDPVEYPFVYVAPSNTGVPSGLDLNNDGTTDGPNDAFGFGFYPGQFGFVIYSKHPIVEEEVRTFQEFLWADMPDALLPEDPLDADGNGDTANWFTPEELEAVRLSSKNHVDLPVEVDGEVIHVLASHPTPPVFDGPEDLNGRRNFDEIRFWADYINGEDYIYDDAGVSGGLADGANFVIMGDQNSDPNDGDSIPGAIQQLLDDLLVNTSITPSSAGGPDAAERQGSNNADHLTDPAFDTADFGEAQFGGPGNLRVDYALPSSTLDIVDAEVFWLPDEDPLFERLNGDFPFPTSDHRLVSVDVAAPASEQSTVTDIEFLGEVTFPTGFIYENTEMGGLSGLAYDADNDLYYAISDDRSQINPARYYTLDIDLSDGSLDDGDVTFTDVTTLLGADGEPYPEASLDPEGIGLTNDGTLYISSEGDANALVAPFLNEFSLDGQQLTELPVDDKFVPTADQSSGIRNNLAFESVTLTPDGASLYTATEGALFQDGPEATVDNGSLSRIVQYDLETGEAVAEFVYEVEPVPEEPIPADTFNTNGLVELLAIDDDGKLLALERGFSVGQGNTVKLFEIKTQDATNVIDDLMLSDADDFTAVTKTELLDVEADLGIAPDNLEALAFGPTLADGRQSLIIASDNNFNANGQFTQFLAFAVEVEPITPVNGTNAGETLVGDATPNLINSFGGDDIAAGDLGSDTINGGDGDDVLRGDLNSRSSGGKVGGDDIIHGGAGNDRIGGKAGDDQLFGDAGDDAIWGDDGDDLLRGGLGNDTLTGDDFSRGQGSDTFVLAMGEGTDTIVDFEVGTDFIGLADGLTFADLSFGGNEIVAGGEVLAIVQGATESQLNNVANFTLV
ncbi:MAG: esterase-like activity of phytase family protein [Cyanobacteria bacterium J06626_18]